MDTGREKTIEENSLLLSEEGKYQIRVVQKDEAGNISKQEWKKNIYIDGSKPRISLEGKTVNRYEKDGCKLKVTIKDSYLDAESIRWQTTGKVVNQTVKEGVLKADIYFEKEGEQKLSVSCRDHPYRSLSGLRRRVIDSERTDPCDFKFWFRFIYEKMPNRSLCGISGMIPDMSI